MQLLVRWAFYLSAVVAGILTARAETAPEPKAPMASSAVAAPKPRNKVGARRFESTVTAIQKVDGVTRITLQDGTLTISVKPTTLVLREERGLGASDLQIGDTLSLTALRGARSKISIKESASVTSVNPMVLKVGEVANMTLNKADAWEFNRSTRLDATALAIGQTVAVELGLQRDGDINTNRVAIIVAKPKAARIKKVRPRKSRVRKTAPTPTPAPEDSATTTQNAGA